MIIKELSKKQLLEIVEVHKASFPNFFLTSLGPEFLYTYYESVQKEPEGILLAFEDNNRVLGFCAGCINVKGFNSNLIKHNFPKYVIQVLKLGIRKPGALIHLYKNFTKKGENDDPGNYSELLSIGVAPSAQNNGIGRILLIELERILKKEGVELLSLTTDFDHNENTLRFYSRMGFKTLYEFTTHPKRRMYRLIKELKS